MRNSRRGSIAAAALALTALAAACSGGGSKSSTPVIGGISTATALAPHATATADARPRPDGVPAAAQLERAGRDIGAASVPSGTDPSTVPMFTSTSCTGDVLTIVTTKVTVYADLPCDRALPQDNAELFAGKPVHIRLVVADPSKLLFDSAAAGSVEFTVGRIWTAAP